MTRPLLLLAALGASLRLLAPCAHAASSPVAIDDPPPFGSFQPAGPFGFLAGPIDFRFEYPGQPVIEFTAIGYEVPGYPRSLLVPESPLGAGVLYASDAEAFGDYELWFEALGVSVPIGWIASEDAAYGWLEQLVVTVRAGSVLSEESASPGGGGGGPRVWINCMEEPASANTISILVCTDQECAITFKQFFCQTLSWKGTNAAGQPVSGEAGPNLTFPGQTVPGLPSSGNAGVPSLADGSRVYVDAPAAGDSDYPLFGCLSLPCCFSLTCCGVKDAPNMRAPSLVDFVLEAFNPGVNVTEVTWEVEYVTYVLMQCPGQQDPVPVKKISWTYSETVETPDEPSTEEHLENGTYGGPGEGRPGPNSGFTNGLPTVDDVAALDPAHATALTNFENGDFTGAPCPQQ
jgi:hypothetical protein